MNFIRIKEKLNQSGYLGLSAAAMRMLARRLDAIAINRTKELTECEEKSRTKEQPIGKDEVPTLDSPEYAFHQESAYRILSRYMSMKDKDVLEVGGAQSGASGKPFLKDGARSVTISGLDHISQEQTTEDPRMRVVKANGLALTQDFEPCSIDVIYGLSLIEHIPKPEVFLQEIFEVLRPGGLVYLEGNPLWSSAVGHHVWVANWGGKYQGKTTANYLFNDVMNVVATNPLPDWSHLLMSRGQMTDYLISKSIPSGDIDCIIDWVYEEDNVNRLDSRRIADAYATSKLTMLEAVINRRNVPGPVLEELRKKHGEGIDYGIDGVVYVLAKPLDPTA